MKKYSIPASGKYKDSIAAKFEELFGMDLRALAFFRISLGLIILYDLCDRARDLKFLYTDAGVMPRSYALYEINASSFSLYLSSGTEFYSGCLFILTAISAMALLIGWKTRLAVFLSWLFMMSLHLRNPWILNGGDSVLKLSLFWSLFLPLGARASADQLLKKERPPENSNRTFSAATFAFMLQVVFVYSFGIINKFRSPEWTGGTAVYYALQDEYSAKALASLLLGFPQLLSPLTYAVLRFELLGPLFLFFPFFTAFFRTAAILGFFFLQGGMAMFMELGIFPAMMSIVMIPFLPSSIFDAVTHYYDKSYKARMAPLLERVKKYIHSCEEQRKKYLNYACHFSMPQSGRWVNALAAFFILYIFLWNLGMIGSRYRIPPPLQGLGYFLHLDQWWPMYSPPNKVTGWFLFSGQLKDGGKIDLLRDGKPLSYERPELPSAISKTDRWRRYLAQAGYMRNFTSQYLVAWLCREWNSSKPEDLKVSEIEMIYLGKTIAAPGNDQISPVYSPFSVAKTTCPA